MMEDGERSEETAVRMRDNRSEIQMERKTKNVGYEENGGDKRCSVDVKMA